ncbi:MAG: hypothetical protein SGILL_000993 [Bacillariaceae sp.]
MSAGRPLALGLAIAPYLAMGSLIQYCRTRKSAWSLNDQLEITSLHRKALQVHFWYFLLVPILIEVFPDAPGLDVLVGPPPNPDNNMLHMITCLAAENFFVTSTALGMILMQESVPRWALLTLFSQLAWNLKNHLSWFFLGGRMAPEGPMPFAVIDMILIWPIVYVYARHFLYGPKVDKKD